MNYRVPTKDYRRQYEADIEVLLAELRRTILEDDPILGDRVSSFESAFAGLVGSNFGVGVGSGTDALVLALRASGIGERDEVITAADTFAATPIAIRLAGAVPVFVDVDPATMNLEVDAAAAALTSQTRAVVPVHLYGRMAEGFEQLDADVVVIEDAAQAHGACDGRGIAAGSVGRAGCFSFHPSKNLGAFGDGGIIVTNDAALDDRLRRLRHLGKRTKYDFVEASPNTKLDTLQAAILLFKLPRLTEWNDRRRRIASTYRAELAGVGDLDLPEDPGGRRHVWHLFAARTSRRDELRSFLRERGVNTGMQYPRPPHLQDVDWGRRYARGQFPVAESIAARVITLPCSHELSDDEIAIVIAAVKEYFRGR